VASIKSEKPAKPADATGGTPGTSDPAQAGPKVETNDLRPLGVAYHSFQAANGNKAPQALADLMPLLAADPKSVDHLRAGRVVFLYGVPLTAMRAGTSNTILAYEKDVPAKGGLTLYADGSIRTLTAAQFASAPKATP
jgi:hypothetical protein